MSPQAPGAPDPIPAARAPAASPVPLPPPAQDLPLTWRETRALIRSDLDRLVRHLQQPDTFAHRAYDFLLPGMQALFWHRINRYLLLRGWRRLASVLHLMAIYLTRAEVPPTTSIGPSALIAHATGVYLFGRIGARLTVQGSGGCGGGFGETEIGGGPGYAVLGDDVTLAFGARVLGPVRIGDGVKVGPGALVTDDVPAGALVMWAKPRIIQGGALAAAPAAAPAAPPVNPPPAP